jgi:RNA polymerase sigma-70 factor (ECF subfamily)
VHDPEPEDVDTSDEDLLARSASRPVVFAAFYERHAHQLLAFFARRTFDAEVAADLTAETFAQAFASRARFRALQPGGAEAWLYTIARRQLSRFLRRHRVETRARERLEIPSRQLTSEDHDRIEQLIDFEAVGRAISGALAQLSRGQRDAVVLRVIEGKSYADVASTTGCSEIAARAQVSRGLHRLRALLEPLSGSQP